MGNFKINVFVRISLFFLIFALLFIAASLLMRDKRMTFSYDVSRKVRGFYNEPENSLDVVFIGSSHMYSTVVPAVLWEEYGITSYNFGANEQPLWISYYYIKEALKTQSPDVIALDVYYAHLGELQKEGTNRINLDDLKWSRNKIEAIDASVPEEERVSYYIDLMKYHGNWKNLSKGHFIYMWNNGERNPYKGYSPFAHQMEYPDVVDQSYAQTTDKWALPPLAEAYLIKIIELAQEEGFKLLLFKTPDGSANMQHYYNAVADIAAEYGVNFINYNTIMPGEPHNNIINAEKFTRHLGEYLQSRFAIANQKENPARGYWNEDSAYFYQEKNEFLISTEEDFSHFLELANNKHYLVMAAANGDVSGDYEPYLQQWKALGFQEDLSGAENQSYIGIIDKGALVYEAIGTQALEFQYQISGWQIQVSSQNGENSQAHIYFGEHDYLAQEKGLHFVVYDQLLGRVVGRIRFIPSEAFAPVRP